MEQFHDSPDLTVWNCEKGLKLCFGLYLQVVGASKTPSEDTFFSLKYLVLKHFTFNYLTVNSG